MVKSSEINLERSYSSLEILAILRADGWFLHKSEGSHHQFKHPTKRGKVTVKHPDKNVPIKTFRSILKQAGLDMPSSSKEG